MTMASTTDKKKAINIAGKNDTAKNIKPYQFQPGNVANPKGRPKGSRNKFAEEFIKDFLADWEMAGPSAIQNCRLDDPAAYLRIAASLIPKEFSIKDGESILDKLLEQLPADQLADFITALANSSVETQGVGHKAKALPGSQPDGLHQVLLQEPR